MRAQWIRNWRDCDRGWLDGDWRGDFLLGFSVGWFLGSMTMIFVIVTVML